MKVSERMQMWQHIASWCSDFWLLVFEYCPIAELYKLLQLDSFTHKLVTNFPQYLIHQLKYFITHSEDTLYMNIQPPIRLQQLPTLEMLKIFCSVSNCIVWHQRDCSLNELLLYMNHFPIKTVEKWKDVLYFLMDQIPFDPFFVKCHSKVPFIVENATIACRIVQLCNWNKRLKISYFNQLLSSCHFIPSKDCNKCIPCDMNAIQQEDDTNSRIILWCMFMTKSHPNLLFQQHLRRIRPSEELLQLALDIYGANLLHNLPTEIISKELYWKALKRSSSVLRISALKNFMYSDHSIMEYALRSPFAEVVPTEYWSASVERLVCKLIHCEVPYTTLKSIFKEEWRSNVKIVQASLISSSSNIAFIKEEDWQKEEFVVPLLSQNRLKFKELKLPQSVKSNTKWMERIVYANTSAWEYCSAKFKSNILNALHVIKEDPYLFNVLDIRLQKNDDIRQVIIDSKMEQLFISDIREREAFIRRQENAKRRTYPSAIWRLGKIPYKNTKQDCINFMFKKALPYFNCNNNIIKSRLKAHGLHKDAEFMKQCVAINPFIFGFADESLRKDKELLTYVATCDAAMIEHFDLNEITDTELLELLYEKSKDTLTLEL